MVHKNHRDLHPAHMMAFKRKFNSAARNRTLQGHIHRSDRGYH